jgi:hypothetical protein
MANQPPQRQAEQPPPKKAKRTDPVLLAVSRLDRIMQEVAPEQRAWAMAYLKAKYDKKPEGTT